MALSVLSPPWARMASDGSAIYDFVMRRYPGVIPATPDELYAPREVTGFTELRAGDLSDWVSADVNVTHMGNVVSAAWPRALRKLKALLNRGAIAANVKVIVPDIPDDEKESVFRVTRGAYTEVFEYARDVGFVQKNLWFLVRAYTAPQEAPAIEASAVADAVLFDGKFEFKNMADKGDSDYLHYLRQARAQNRQFVKVMTPIYELAKSMAVHDLYINDLSGVHIDDEGRTCVSGFEFLANKPTMDIDFVSAFVLYAHLTAKPGQAPDYSFLDGLYAKSPRSKVSYIPTYPEASVGIPDDAEQAGGGIRTAPVAWAALAAITVACSMIAPLA